MRHEITQQQYVDFLNMRPFAAQSARSGRQVNAPPGTLGIKTTHADWGSSRLGVKIAESGVANRSDPVVIRRETFVASRTRENPGKPAVYTADEPYVACNFLSPADGSHYAAWAGLRPMSELEFEKACRGPLKPVPNEYAWGTDGIAGMGVTNGVYRLRNAGKPDETIAWEGDGGPDATHGNAVMMAFPVESDAKPQGFGPLRAGIFATPASDRVRAGASYWGILDLSGNVIERCITVGTPIGRAFMGTHGDGNASSWNVNGFCARGGGCSRGGNAAALAGPHRVSDRSHGAQPFHDARKNAQGFRCVRTAPGGN
jgi:formylglycine-generating enzyme required for sulfatase activity